MIRLKRRGALAVAILALAGLWAPFFHRPAPFIIWNASASAPIGLYMMAPRQRLVRGDLVLADLPQPIRSLAAERRYLPLGVRLIKRIAALSGDEICSRGMTITINGQAGATRLPHDAQGRVLPVWTGCRSLQDGEVFLLMAAVPDSFDGRYFGPIHASDITGRLMPIWTR